MSQYPNQIQPFTRRNRLRYNQRMVDTAGDPASSVEQTKKRKDPHDSNYDNSDDDDDDDDDDDHR